MEIFLQKRVKIVDFALIDSSVIISAEYSVANFLYLF